VLKHPCCLGTGATGYNSSVLRNIILALVVLACCSCGLLPAKLEQRAADYYSFQVGHLPKAKYSAFLTPAYRAIANPDGLSQLDAAMRKSTSPSERYARITAAQVTVQQDGLFAMTTVDSSLGGSFRDGKPIRWVRVGRRWFIYLGSDAEVEQYGMFPPNLTRPALDQHRPATAPPLLNSGRKAAQPDPAFATGVEEAVPADEESPQPGGDETTP
jgi:hypothetical protein